VVARQTVEDTHTASEAWREEIRSEIRELNRRFTIHEDRMTLLNAKLDALAEREDEDANGHLENGG